MALPPSPMASAPMGSAGPGGPHTGNPGRMADAMTKVRGAVQILQEALPALEVGTEPHKAVLKMIQEGSKVVPANEEHHGVQESMLAGLAERAKQMQMLHSVQNSMGGQGAGGPPGGAQPPQPPQ